MSYRNNENHETSNWVPAFENSVLEEFENENNIYAHRKIGVKEPVKWKNKKCPSCSLWIHNKSFPLKYDGCDSYTHKKPSCLSKAIQNSQFYCKTYLSLFVEENINMTMLLDLDTEEFMNMTKELGISTWGQRRNLKKAIEDHKAKNKNLEELDNHVEDVDNYVEDVDNYM